MELSATETRVLGCLLEKQRTTPDAYPLSLNALRLACNQSTNRDPVVDYDEAVIRDALHRLERRGYTRLASGAGSRAAKYRHLLAEALPMSSSEQAVMCVLMLRGPQTPGELKQRTERMHAFGDLSAVHDTLDHLIDRELVARLERRPGHKEERYAQLLQGEEEHGPGREPAAAAAAAYAHEAPAAAEPFAHAGAPHVSGAPAASAQPPPQDLLERVARLEREVAELRASMRHPVPERQP
ncbi:MAG: YceH family protein [Solirubrobacteraceae bacterium]